MSTEAIHPRPPRRVAIKLLDASGLPSADLTDAHMDHFFYCGSAAVPIGLVGLELCGPDALLRSLVVVPQRRSTGLGAALMAHAEAYARAQGARAVYLLTITAETFFRRHGYVVAIRDDAPVAIRATREFAGLCPASSAFLVKRI